MEKLREILERAKKPPPKPPEVPVPPNLHELPFPLSLELRLALANAYRVGFRSRHVETLIYENATKRAEISKEVIKEHLLFAKDALEKIKELVPNYSELLSLLDTTTRYVEEGKWTEALKPIRDFRDKFETYLVRK